MANKNYKLRQNVAGKYCVDSGCINCGQCHSVAPDFFVDNSMINIIYVAKQLKIVEEITMCEKALTICPVNSIESDGE